MVQTFKKLQVIFAPLALLLISSPIASAWYDPGMQRWITRDPVSEAGFESAPLSPIPASRDLLIVEQGKEASNLFTFVGNSPTMARDALGLSYSGPHSKGSYCQKGGGYCNPDTTGSYTCRRGTSPAEKKAMCFWSCAAACSLAAAGECAQVPPNQRAACMLISISLCSLGCVVVCGL